MQCLAFFSRHRLKVISTEFVGWFSKLEAWHLWTTSSKNVAYQQEKTYPKESGWVKLLHGVVPCGFTPPVTSALCPEGFSYMHLLLILFVILRLAKHAIEHFLAVLNKHYYADATRQAEAARELHIEPDNMQASLRYALDRHRFGTVHGWIQELLLLLFLCVGGLGLAEQFAAYWAGDNNELLRGLVFFASLGLLSMLLGITGSYYRTFYIEARHGFNRQTRKGFVLDLLKGTLLGIVLGGVLLTVLLFIMMHAGRWWWVYGWMFVFGFSLVTMWIYPMLLAPLFNKFRPIEEGELRDGIFAMAAKVGFKTDAIYVMDASKRSSHGNAYFTGVFGEKRIVLFDTLINTLGCQEIIAVLAHEIGHYKLHHIRWQLVRSFVMTGVIFLLLDMFIAQESFYHAFSLNGISSYAALTLFFMWFGLLEFLLQPITSLISRRNEFAADAFARQAMEGSDQLANGLLKLRADSKSMPLSHPWFSAMYHSHPPIIERVQTLRK